MTLMTFALTPPSPKPLNSQMTSSLESRVVNSVNWLLSTETNLLIFDDPCELSSWAVISPDFAHPQTAVLYSTQYNVAYETNVCWPSKYSILRTFLSWKSTVCVWWFSVVMHQYNIYWYQYWFCPYQADELAVMVLPIRIIKKSGFLLSVTENIFSRSWRLQI